MVETEIVETDEGAGLGIQINLPHSRLLLVRAEKGYLVCGYFKPETIEKFKDAAVIISPAKNFKQMLRSKVKYVSKAAKKLKINEKMTGRQALNKML